jgi:maltooligosyltrehalose trehalohydrolase
LSMLLSVPQLKAIAALTLLSPFVPLLFQGEEWGAATPFLYFTDHQDAKLGRLVAAGRAKEFSAFRWQGAVPNPQEPDTFLRSKLNWTEISQPAHGEILEWYRALIRLRRDKVEIPRESEADSAGPQVHFDAGAEWLAFVHNGVLAVFNLGDRPQRVPMPEGEWQLVLRSDSRDVPLSDAPLSDAMPARTTFIYMGG